MVAPILGLHPSNRLTLGEYRVAKPVSEGLRDLEIAQTLKISESTVGKQ